jgi:N-hydroxyarylamine O-acetyltransferase
MTQDVAPPLDLQAYLARIEYGGALRPDLATLEGLHLAHSTHIPFENLAILLGRPIRLDLASLQAKLVGDERGGYCFEHNSLFAAVLEALGFRVTRLAARVRFGATRVLPRTHMLLEVEAGGRPWLVDVGFGAGGLLTPIPLAAGEVVRQPLDTFRLAREGELWVLQSALGAEWGDLYAFTREPQLPVDFELANYFTSTHPESIFVRSLTAQRQSLEMRWTLRNRELVVEAAGRAEKRLIAGDELGSLLALTFGLRLAADSVATLVRAAGF